MDSTFNRLKIFTRAINLQQLVIFVIFLSGRQGTRLTWCPRYGKTFTMANVIQKLNKPALLLPQQTLAVSYSLSSSNS